MQSAIVGHQSYLFKGTVGDALRMGRPGASDAELWAVLERVKLADFFRGGAMVDLPHPLSPTMAVKLPCGMFRSTP